MSKNTKQTSTRIGRLASETLQNSGSSQIAKSLAASALAQRSGDKQTGAKMEDVAARVLASDRYANDTKNWQPRFFPKPTSSAEAESRALHVTESALCAVEDSLA